MSRFGTVVTAMVTPFDDEGALDLAAAAHLAQWLANHGSDGLVVGGTTGEGSVLTDAEKLDLFKAVAEAVTVPVVASTASNDTGHSVELTRAAKGCGIDGILVVTPYYNRPSQAGIEAHFRAVAGATALPALIYDIPVRTGRKVAHEVLVRLAHEVPNVVGVKDAAGDVAASARLLAAVPSSFELYSGNDDQTLALTALGAVGVVSVSSHWIGPQIGQMIAAVDKGDLVTARQISAQTLDAVAFQSSDAAPNPIPAKAMMRVMGHAVGQCRLPMGVAPEGLEDRAREVLAALG